MTSPLDQPASHTNPELLVSAVLHLMSHYAANTAENGPCLKLGAIIERHLRALAAFPDLPPILRATCQQLSEQWSNVVKQAQPPAVRRGFFTRWMGGAQGT
ncbi:MAG TPA: hypothetical protein VEB70_03355 [Noviherbaspirillum sp.]|nr:hypothetical protein [Noviherbaspirillum sp.]